MDTMADKEKNKSASTNSTVSSGVSRLSLIRNVTRECLSNMTFDELHDANYVESTILDSVQTEIDLQNTIRPKGHKWKTLDELIPAQIADIIAYIYPVARIMTGGVSSDEDYDLLAIYQEDGPDKGTYVVSDQAFRKLARQYDYGITNRSFEEMMTVLRDEVKRVVPCKEKNLIAVNNGIFDYDTKQLMPFDPKYIFMSKSRVNYVQHPLNPVIHNDDDGTDWNVESWMNELSDDPEIVNLLWEILGAIIRPLVSWNKSAWFYSETGNNGKGTLCELMRELSGKSAYTSIPIALFSKDFMLEPLLSVSAIIVDENDVGDYIDRSANLKAVITNDVIFVNRKFQKPLSIQYRGFMVQCINELPKLRDRSQSMLRRLLIVPMLKCFTGHERKYIKNDYLHRKDVLEYVMYRVLNSNFYELSEPHACKELLGDYRIYNNPVEDFWHQFRDLFVWDLLPYEFLYELYKSYINVVNPQSSVMGRNTFTRELRAVVLNDPTQKWIAPPNPRIRGDHMNCIEDLIVQYQLYSFCRNCQIATKPTSIISDQEKKKSYRGLVRNKSRLNP